MKSQSASGKGAQPGKVAHPLDLETFLPYRFHQLASRMAEAGASLSALVHHEDPSISLRDWRIMAVLAARRELSSAQIARLTAMEPATVTRAVQHLKRHDLVLTRTTSRDRRLLLVTLSEAGAALHDKVAPARIQTGDDIISCLDSSQREMLYSILDALDRRLDTLEEQSADLTPWR